MYYVRRRAYVGLMIKDAREAITNAACTVHDKFIVRMTTALAWWSRERRRSMHGGAASTNLLRSTRYSLLFVYLSWVSLRSFKSMPTDTVRQRLRAAAQKLICESPADGNYTTSNRGFARKNVDKLVHQAHSSQVSDQMEMQVERCPRCSQRA